MVNYRFVAGARFGHGLASMVEQHPTLATMVGVGPHADAEPDGSVGKDLEYREGVTSAASLMRTANMWAP